jgi:hypothetical protein
VEKPRYTPTLYYGEGVPQDGLAALAVEEECDAVAAAVEGHEEVDVEGGPQSPTS